MRYQVKLKKTEEGYTVCCPSLPGCWSQGNTKEEALENIKDAIQAYLETLKELNQNPKSHLSLFNNNNSHIRNIFNG